MKEHAGKGGKRKGQQSQEPTSTWSASPGSTASKTRPRTSPPAERHAARRAQAKPIVEPLPSWLDPALPEVPPCTLIGQALTYLHN